MHVNVLGAHISLIQSETGDIVIFSVTGKSMWQVKGVQRFGEDEVS